jgi:hypothetical protein
MCATAMLVLLALAVSDAPLYAEVSTTGELLAAVAELDPGKGGTITLLPGAYELTEPLVFKGARMVVIAGSGWNTSLVASGGHDAIRLEDAAFCVVKDLLIDQSAEDAAGGSGVVFTGQSSSCEVRHCRIQRFALSGVRFEGVHGKPMSSNVVADCHFIGNRRAQLWSYENNDFMISGNQFGVHRGTPEVGVVLERSSAGNYTGNYHWDNVVGVRVGPLSHYNRIANNRFEESRHQGLVINGEGGDPSYHTIISGNTFHTNSKTNPGQYSAVAAWNAHDVVFSSNNVFSWDAATTRHLHGLEMHGCKSWVIGGNIFRNHEGEAILATECENLRLSDNIGQGEE